MELTKDITKYIDQSVLCWLATSSRDNIPNVSPKEIFTNYGDEHLIVANIASPQSVKNIKQNPNVCVSFIDILVQKGYQLKGKAEIIDSSFEDYAEMESLLKAMTGDKFPFPTITKIKIESGKKIVAPSYLLFPDTKEEDQIAGAKTRYGLH